MVIASVARKHPVVKQVLLIDEHPLIHEVMRRVIARALRTEEVLVANGVAEATRLLSELPGVGLVIMDLRDEGSCGIAAFSEMRRRFPRPRYVMLSDLDDRETIARALEAGAHGYLTKMTPVSVIEAVLALIAAGGTYAPHEIMRNRSLVTGGRPSLELDLTERQLDVLRLLLDGLANREIAKALQISESTVKQHVRAIFHALNVSTRTEALVAITKRGIKLD